jgi:hypothetical protein
MVAQSRLRRSALSHHARLNLHAVVIMMMILLLSKCFELCMLLNEPALAASGESPNRRVVYDLSGVVRTQTRIKVDPDNTGKSSITPHCVAQPGAASSSRLRLVL